MLDQCGLCLTFTPVLRDVKLAERVGFEPPAVALKFNSLQLHRSHSGQIRGKTRNSDHLDGPP